MDYLSEIASILRRYVALKFPDADVVKQHERCVLMMFEERHPAQLAVTKGANYY